jgi:hypothetical protein
MEIQAISAKTMQELVDRRLAAMDRAHNEKTNPTLAGKVEATLEAKRT